MPDHPYLLFFVTNDLNDLGRLIDMMLIRDTMRDEILRLPGGHLAIDLAPSHRETSEESLMRLLDVPPFVRKIRAGKTRDVLDFPDLDLSRIKEEEFEKPHQHLAPGRREQWAALRKRHHAGKAARKRR